MPIVAVKKKFQIVIPQDLRKVVRLRVGDLLEAKADRGTITLTPKSLVDREIAEGLEDLREGRTYGPYASAQDMIAALHRMTRRPTKKKPSARAQNR